MSQISSQLQTDAFAKDWTRLAMEEKDVETSSAVTITYWQDVRRRLWQNKLAIASIFVILLILLASVFGPPLTGKSYDAQQLSLRNMPPRIEIQTAADGTNFYVHQDLKVFLADASGYVGEELAPVSAQLKDKVFVFEHNDQTYYLSFSDGVKFEDENHQPLPDKKTVWNQNYLLGTDSIGRDMLTRLLYGGRISLLVAFVVTFCTLLIGVIYGGAAGYYGRNTDILLMRVVEILMSIPATIYIILLMVYFGQGLN
jgi:oligopeptide transport system permease protein